jgi:uncharacterized membrane protein YhaH (DUF805 family)
MQRFRSRSTVPMAESDPGLKPEQVEERIMSFADAVKTCFRKYVDFKGRATRPEYWWFALFCVVAYVGASVLAVAGKVPELGALAILGLILPQLSAAVRRLHDTGRSGAWYFIALVPYVGGIVLIVLLAQSGQPQPNQYGPPVGGTLMPPVPHINGMPVPPPPPESGSRSTYPNWS